MKLFTYYIIFVLYIVCSLQAMPANIKTIFEWSSIPPQARAEIISSIRFEDVSFQDQTLSNCLEKLSQMTSDVLGSGFSIITVNNTKNIISNPKITFKFKDITLREILKYLAMASNTNIEMTASGCVVTYGKKE